MYIYDQLYVLIIVVKCFSCERYTRGRADFRLLSSSSGNAEDRLLDSGERFGSHEV